MYYNKAWHLSWCSVLFGGLFFLSACQKELPPVNRVNYISDSVDLYGDANLGLAVYSEILDQNGRACINCHLSPNGEDIARFGKLDKTSQDSIVVHRAQGHVTKTNAYHVAAYLKSLNISPNGNAPIGELIGVFPGPLAPSVVWNGSTSLTKTEIETWNFRSGMKFQFSTPKWFEGDETNLLIEDNLDWLPEIDILTEKGNIVTVKYATYVNSPTKENLKEVLLAAHTSLTEGERHPGEHGYFDFNKSFDYQRWMATLYMQHITRTNSDLQFGEELSGYSLAEFSLADGIWDVGNIARRSQDNGRSSADEIENRLKNEVQWLYLGWLTNYGKRNSFETQYIGTALKDYNHRDLASLVILKSLVNRSPNSVRMYDDIFTMSYITSDQMFYRSLEFGLDYLTDGIASANPFFNLLNSAEINNTLSNLKNSNPSIPDVYQSVEAAAFLSTNQKDALKAKIDILYNLVEDML